MRRYPFQTVVLVLLSFALGCSEFIVVGILSDIASDLHVSNAAVGSLVTIFALVYAVSTPFVTLFLGKCNHYISMMALAVVFIAGNLLSAFSGSYALLCVSRVLTAVVSGPLISLSLMFANRIAPERHKPLIISWVFSGFSIASVMGVPIGAWISSLLGWKLAFFTIALFSILVLALLALTLPRTQAESAGGLAEQLHLFHDRRIRVGMLLPMFGAAGVYAVYTYLRPLFSTALGYSVHSISLLLFLFGLTSIVSNQLSGLLAKGDGLRKMPPVYLLQTALMLLLPLLVGSRFSGTMAIMVLGVTMYLLNSPIQLHFLSVAETDYPESIVLASSLNSIFFNFGISLGSLTGSLIVDNWGLSDVGIGGGILSFVALVLVLALNRLMAGRKAMAQKLG